MRNMRDFGIVTGRLTRDPDFHDNRDGSRKVRFTVAAQNHFTDKDGKRGSLFIPLDAFLSYMQEGIGVYGYLELGDLVTCSFTILNNNYKDKNGNMVYGLSLLVDTVTLLETKAAKEARLAAKAAS